MVLYNYAPLFQSAYYNLKPYFFFFSKAMHLFLCLFDSHLPPPLPISLSKAGTGSVLAHHRIPNAQCGSQRNPLTAEVLNG